MLGIPAHAPPSAFPEPALLVESWNPHSLPGVGWLNPGTPKTENVIVLVGLVEVTRVLSRWELALLGLISQTSRRCGGAGRDLSPTPRLLTRPLVLRGEVTCWESQDPKLSLDAFRALPSLLQHH